MASLPPRQVGATQGRARWSTCRPLRDRRGRRPRDRAQVRARIDPAGERAELPWAYGVARRCLANSRRTERRRLRLVERLAAQPPPAAVVGPGEDGDPRLEAAMARLRDDDREVLRLWAWEDLGPHEIAAALGISANAASIRLHRARGRLARLVGTGKGALRGGQVPGGRAEGDEVR